MKHFLIGLLLLTFFPPTLPAAPIVESVQQISADTVIYHATNATLKSVSTVKFDKQTGEDRIILEFTGEWQINPDLHGAQIRPQAGIIIGADTPGRKRRLEELRRLTSSLPGKRVNIYIYGGSVNKDRTTYTWPELIKIIPAK